MDGEEYLTDELDIIESEIKEKRAPFKQKQVVPTEKRAENLKFSENNHIADLQQRVIKLEYELLFMKDKLFEPSRANSNPKLAPYGKIVKRRIAQNG